MTCRSCPAPTLLASTWGASTTTEVYNDVVKRKVQKHRIWDRSTEGTSEIHVERCSKGLQGIEILRPPESV